jgi:phosphoglycolate phosphatase-like HAD superfamily hydrolase
MQLIEGIFFEPVGCLAEFPSGPFLEISSRLFGRKKKATASGSRAYWHLLNLIEASGKNLDGPENELAEALEMQAVAEANVYEDVAPALAELKKMGARLFVVSSLSGAATKSFLDRHGLNDLFSAVWSRDAARGIKAAPLQAALAGASLQPERVMFLADTLESLSVAQSVGVQSILMMNDPDEARRLAMHNPSGGIVSLHELPDFLRVVAAENSGQPGTIRFSSGGSTEI